MAHRDERDNKTWVVYELTSAGETLAEEGQLERHLRSLFKDDCPEIFVPYLTYYCDGRLTLFNVIEGYCFVASRLDEREYFHVLLNNPYLRNVLHTPGGTRSGPVLHTVTEENVLDLRRQLSAMLDIREGMEVEVTRGTCKGLTGLVLGVNEEYVHLLLTLRTLKTIRTVPRYAVLPKGDPP